MDKQADAIRWGYDRLSVLKAVARQNDELGVAARLPFGEMIGEGDRCIADGLMVWEQRGRDIGRFLTEAGRALIAATPTQSPTDPASPLSQGEEGR